jgi:hypothetical protein
LDDVKLMFYMADSVKEEPSVISHLVRINCLNLAIQPIWEGLAERAWSDAQLQKLQTDLRQYDVVRDLKRSLDAERAWNILTIDLGRRRPVLLLEIYGESPTSTRRSLVNLIGRVVPRGWYYQEQLNYCRLDQILLAGVFDKNGKLLLPSRIESSGREFYERVFPERTAFKLVLHHRFMASELLAGPGSFTACRFGWTQTAIDQAALGCALERYRLASGEFPENLDAVVPKFIAKLPRDVINGQPVHYHLTNGRQFVLYSVGWNEKDDGGAPGKGIFDSVNGDWVWQYPAPH